MARFRGVILDVDGTLVDSNDAHASAWVEALAEHGIMVPHERVGQLIGMGGDNLLPELIHVQKDSPLGQSISKSRQRWFMSRFLQTVRPFPSVRDLLLRIREHGMKLVVASSAKKDELDPLLNIAGVTDLIEQTTSADDAEHSKPDPDIVQAAVRQLGFNPQESIMLGDTQYDVQAATKAHVPIIALRSGGRTQAQLAGALAIYDDPAHLLREYDRSPLASQTVTS